MVDQAFYYESMYNMQECIMRIMEEPQRYSCKWGTELWYKAEKISDAQIWITFTGGQFRKMMKTQYLMIPSLNIRQLFCDSKKSYSAYLQ